MNYEEVSTIIQTIFLQYFNVSLNTTTWEQPLEQLQEDFKILDYLLFLEKLLQQQLSKDIVLLENISPAIHSPNDIVALVLKLCVNECSCTV
ncbi:hypothetical protein [Aureispira anguillae]|uniref:Uncharacterized protein n=1 Tax=Aureispira anguillae TaxID=2864201 RepID=A0A915YHT7_9BACT|nr:hypothetical protein [Aureispira anguillae]BDS13438.1 hypothetical protein AsAng_0041750 [Aureispira anguillae]